MVDKGLLQKETQEYLKQAELCLSKKDMTNAIERYQKVLENYHKLHGEKSKEVSDIMVILADCYKKQHEYFKAYDLYQASLVILLEICGEKHAETKKAFVRIRECYVLCQNAKPTPGENIYEKYEAVIKNCIEEYGENSVVTAIAYYELAKAYKEKKENSNANSFFNKALKIFNSVYGENNSEAKKIQEKMTI